VNGLSEDFASSNLVEPPTRGPSEALEATWSFLLPRPPKDRSRRGATCQLAFPKRAFSLYVESSEMSASSGAGGDRVRVGFDGRDLLLDEGVFVSVVHPERPIEGFALRGDEAQLLRELVGAGRLGRTALRGRAWASPKRKVTS
jgi:hypothetical protein